MNNSNCTYNDILQTQESRHINSCDMVYKESLDTKTDEQIYSSKKETQNHIQKKKRKTTLLVTLGR